MFNILSRHGSSPSFSPVSFNHYPNFSPISYPNFDPIIDYNNNYTDGWVSYVKYDYKNCSGSPSSVSNNYYGNCLIGNSSWSIRKLIDLGELSYYYYYFLFNE